MCDIIVNISFKSQQSCRCWFWCQWLVNEFKVIRDVSRNYKCKFSFQNTWREIRTRDTEKHCKCIKTTCFTHKNLDLGTLILRTICFFVILSTLITVNCVLQSLWWSWHWCRCCSCDHCPYCKLDCSWFIMTVDNTFSKYGCQKRMFKHVFLWMDALIRFIMTVDVGCNKYGCQSKECLSFSTVNVYIDDLDNLRYSLYLKWVTSTPTYLYCQRS